jgi:hypothetical protein
MKSNFFLIFLKPFIWTYKKIINGFKYFFNNYNKITIVIVPTILLAIFGLTFILDLFRDIKNDTTSLTNYGFAILAGLATICFSWTRGLDNSKEPIMIRKISRCGELAIQSAIIFLLASALKYSAIHIDKWTFEDWKIISMPLGAILNISYALCFTFASYKTYDVLIDINKILYERLHLNKRE